MGIQRESAELAAVVEETVSGVRVTKGLGADRVQADRLRIEADDVYQVSMAAARTRARFVPGLELIPNIGFIAVLGYGGNQVLAGELTIGALIAFNVYIAMLIWPLRMLGMIVAQAQRAVAAAQRVHEVLATAPAIMDAPDARCLPARGGEVRFTAVRFGYGGGLPVLDGFDLRIAPGESVALVGATGSGKSTVARLIPRFYDVEDGSVQVDGVDVRHLRLGDLRRAVGLVFEETFLFSDTIAANIAFAEPSASRAAIVRAASLAGADEFIAQLPQGYDTLIGERGYSLSGGQRQRLAIARAILADPRILILDDATSAVDATKEHEIRDALAAVMRGRTTIVIAHRPATIALADRVVLLDGGRVVAEGAHDELLRSDPRYRSVLAAAAGAQTSAVPGRNGDRPTDAGGTSAVPERNGDRPTDAGGTSAVPGRNGDRPTDAGGTSAVPGRNGDRPTDAGGVPAPAGPDGNGDARRPVTEAAAGRTCGRDGEVLPAVADDGNGESWRGITGAADGLTRRSAS
jgi:ATP-binding cassette subfamily B protein